MTRQCLPTRLAGIAGKEVDRTAMRKYTRNGGSCMCISIDIENTRRHGKYEDGRVCGTVQAPERYLVRSRGTQKSFVRCRYTTGCSTTDSIQQIGGDLRREGADMPDFGGTNNCAWRGCVGHVYGTAPKLLGIDASLTLNIVSVPLDETPQRGAYRPDQVDHLRASETEPHQPRFLDISAC
jgi:hypothetical protein